MLEFVEYGNSKIAFKIKRSNRKTLGISVLPCGSIEVTAPLNAEIDKIKSMVLKRGSWLLEQLRIVEYNPIPQPTKQFVSGESFYLLGRHYRLKIFESNYNSVDLLDDKIILNCCQPENRDLKMQLILDWYLVKAFKYLSERFNFYSSRFNQTEITLVIKRLSKRWGEYHPSKKLVVVNAELIVANIECIDYVIVHELCHAIYKDHSTDFYNLLTSRLPRWRDLKNELESNSIGFSNFENAG